MPYDPYSDDQADAVDRELEDMSGNHALARELKKNLRRLRDGVAGPDLAEMARDVLDGNTDLRTVARSSVYSDQLTDAIGRYQRWQEQLTPDERDQFLHEAQRLLGQEAQAD